MAAEADTRETPTTLWNAANAEMRRLGLPELRFGVVRDIFERSGANAWTAVLAHAFSEEA